MGKLLSSVCRWWPSALVVAVVLYATLFPDPLPDDEMPPIPYLDKIIHAILFGGTAGAVAFDYQRARRPHNVLTPRVMGWICAGALVFGGAIEIMQEAMHLGRSGDWLDLVGDAAGIVVAWFAAPPAIRAVLGISRKTPKS